MNWFILLFYWILDLINLRRNKWSIVIQDRDEMVGFRSLINPWFILRIFNDPLKFYMIPPIFFWIMSKKDIPPHTDILPYRNTLIDIFDTSQWIKNQTLIT